MAQQVKDPVLSLLCLSSLLWHGFNLWPGNFCMPWAWQKKKKKKKKKNTYGGKISRYEKKLRKKLSVPGLYDRKGM